MAVSMNFGPLVLTNIGPPSGVLCATPHSGQRRFFLSHHILLALRCAVVRRNR